MHYMHGQIPLKKAIRAPKLQKLVHICYLPAGRFVLGKNVAEVLGTQDRGHSFSNTDRPRPANKVFILFFRRVLCKQFLC